MHHRNLDTKVCIISIILDDKECFGGQKHKTYPPILRKQAKTRHIWSSAEGSCRAADSILLRPDEEESPTVSGAGLGSEILVLVTAC